MNSSPFHSQGNGGYSANSTFGSSYTTTTRPTNPAEVSRLPQAAQPATAPPQKASPEPSSKLANELNKFNQVASELRGELTPEPKFADRCQQAFDVANDLFGNAPTWVCFYRELMGSQGMIHRLFSDADEFGRFLRSEQYHQIQLMLTALRSRDLPENDPNDPQRMITVRLPKSLHEAMCDEAGRLNISVNRLCISRMLQLLDPRMIPEISSKPRGRKPRPRSKPGVQTPQPQQESQPPQSAQSSHGVHASNIPRPQ